MSDDNPHRRSAAYAPGATAGPTFPRMLRHSTEHAQRVYELVQAPVATSVTPAYRDPGSGQCRVPSGRVFVRFAADVSAAARREALRRAGYRILEVPVYAPHAAWLEADNGSVAQALGGIAGLEALPDVENVEPQWLTERAAK